MYPSFMETIWWVFNELYNKGLVYKGFKVSLNNWDFELFNF